MNRTKTKQHTYKTPAASRFSVAEQKRIEAFAIISSYATVLGALETTDFYPMSTLPYPKGKIKHALLQSAITVQDRKLLSDLGKLYGCLGLFLPDEDLAKQPLHALIEHAQEHMLTYLDEFATVVKKHNLYYKIKRQNTSD